MLYICESFPCGSCGVPRRAGPALESLKRPYEQAVRGLQGDEMNNGSTPQTPSIFYTSLIFLLRCSPLDNLNVRVTVNKDSGKGYRGNFI